MNVRKEVSLVNQFGEKMTLRLDTDNEIWFHHEDCNTEFEKIKDLEGIYHVPPKPIVSFKYILNKMEQMVINQFILECADDIKSTTPLIKVG